MFNNGKTEKINFKDNFDVKILKKGNDKFNNFKGQLQIKQINKKTGKEEVSCSENLIVYNLKPILTHLISLAETNATGILNNVRYYSPLTYGEDGLNGRAINSDFFKGEYVNANNYKITFMAFGTNEYQNEEGDSPTVDQFGLYNAVNKNGQVSSDLNINNPTQSDIDNFLYPITEYQFLAREISSGVLVSDSIVRFISRMGTTEGQPVGGQMVYREAGLFTNIFIEENNILYPIMVARKVFADITKTEDIELEFVWTFWA